MRMKMMLISQNIILMPVKKKIVIKRNLTDEVSQSLGLHFHDLHHAHPPLPVQVLVPVPENVRDLVGRNQDPAPGPTGVLLPPEKRSYSSSSSSPERNRKRSCSTSSSSGDHKKRPTGSWSPESRV
ncbi:unnamed protein product, partial [Rangifer tarandus platyrhynchus]